MVFPIWGPSQYKDTVLYIKKLIIKIRRPHERHISIMGILMPGHAWKNCLYLETGSRNLNKRIFSNSGPNEEEGYSTTIQYLNGPPITNPT